MTNDVAIEVAHLSKRFADKTAVNDISFKVHAGEVVWHPWTEWCR